MSAPKLFGCGLVLLVGAYCVEGWSAASYPMLGDDQCFAPAPPHVCDPDMILSITGRDRVNGILRSISASTDCECFEQKYCSNSTVGYTLAMALVRAVAAPTGTPPPGESPVEPLAAFTAELAERWSVGHCADEILIVISTDRKQVRLHHGDVTKLKIPDKIRRTMEKQANEIMAFTNHTLVVDYLLSNYRRLLTHSNSSLSVSLLVLPYKDLSSGVITVMVLVCLLSVGWAVCVTYLLAQIVRRRKQRSSSKPTTASTELDEPAQHRGATTALIVRNGGGRDDARRLPLLWVERPSPATAGGEAAALHTTTATSSTMGGIASIGSADDDAAEAICRPERAASDCAAAAAARHRRALLILRNGSAPAATSPPPIRPHITDTQ